MTTITANPPTHDVPTMSNKKRHAIEPTTSPDVFALLFDTLKNFQTANTTLPDTASNTFAHATDRRGNLLNELNQQDIHHRNGSSRIALTQDGNQPLPDSPAEKIETNSEAEIKTKPTSATSVSDPKPVANLVLESQKQAPTANNKPVKPDPIQNHPENASSKVTGQASPANKTIPASTTAAPASLTATSPAPTPKQSTTPTKISATHATKSAARPSADTAPPVQTKNKPTNVKTTKAAEKPETEPKKSNIERIARVIHAKIGKNETVARVRLDPPAMGNVNVHMRLTNDVLRVKLATEKSDARTILQSQSHDLRTALEAQGFKIDRVDFPEPTNTQTSPDHQQSTTDAQHEAPQKDAQPQNQDKSLTNAVFTEDSMTTENVLTEIVTLDRLDIKA